MFRGKRINFNSLTPLSMTSVQISKSYLLCGIVLSYICMDNVFKMTM